MFQNRALGFWETFKAITHDLCQGFETMCITTKVVGKVDLPLFIKALEFSYHRHPLLQATIQEQNNVYHYVFNTSFDDIPIQFKKGVDERILQQSFYEGINCSLEPQRSLWKVDVFYENNELVFTMVIHHSPCDGRSMMNLVDDILYSYSCYLNHELPNRPYLPLLPPTEHLVTKNSTIEDYLKQRQELIAVTTESSSMLSCGPQNSLFPMEQRSTHILYKELSAEQTKRIVNFCTKNNVTSNSFLNGLMLNVAQRLHEHPLSLAMLTPVHTKPLIGSEHMGCHVCLVTTLYEDIDSDSNILKLSQDYQMKLKQEIPKQAHLPKEFTKNDVCNAFGLNLSLDFYKYQLVVSNLGEAPILKKYKDSAVEKVKVGVNNRVGAIACVLITYILHNKIQLGFVYTKPLVSDDYIERFTNQFMQILQDF